ncbi:MAG TPA: FHA domain-containing protein, partial [Nitrospiraceae bacterium]
MPHTVSAQAKLLVKLQGQGSRILDLATDSFTIGRKADNDLAIDVQTISSRHARIVKVQSVFFVEDLKSTNGTSVNGKRIERHQLRDADVISIGQHRLIFQDNVALSAPSTIPVDMDQTVVLHGQDRIPTRPSAVAHLVVTSGKTDQLEYTLA